MQNSRAKHFLALFLISLSVVLWEILLTRIYSVTMFYHFAFMAVSVAMFGLTAGAVLIFLSPFLKGTDADTKLGLLALLTGILMTLSIITELSVPLNYGENGLSMQTIPLIYFLSALPLIPAGAFVSILLTRFNRIGTLYAWDLAGCAAGCLLMPPLISWLGAIGAVFAAGAASCLGSFILFLRLKPALSKIALSVTFGFLAVGIVNVHTSWIRIWWDHNGYVPISIYERWNAFSRIVVTPHFGLPYGWGIAPEIDAQFPPVKQLWLTIDSGAGTALCHYNGRLEDVKYLRYDVSDFCNRLRHGSVCVIGVGGGRDVLAAMTYGQPSIVGVEINPNIMKAVNKDFAGFTGHLSKRPGVQFVTEDGRSYLAGTASRFDIIQASLVDTNAATASGAYAFVENGLYTVEGWRIFFHRLRPKGILSFSRWYYGVATEFPAEVCRLVALSSQALRLEGIPNPSRHILLIRAKPIAPHEELATILVSPQEFSNEDIRSAHKACLEMQCDVVLSFQDHLDPWINAVIAPGAGAANFPVDISSPTDDHPYFFYYPRSRQSWHDSALQLHPNSMASEILIETMRTVIVLGLLLILVQPISHFFKANRSIPKFKPAAFQLPCYFALIGLGFMFVEIGLMQRFSLFLGHPVYSFTVVLFGLLLSTSLGSFSTEMLLPNLKIKREWIALALLIPTLLGMELAGQWLLKFAAGWEIIPRILASIIVISPSGFFMGFFFPFGMKLARQSCPRERQEWFWVINGAVSCIGSVLAMWILLTAGIQLTLWLGAGAYSLAAVLCGPLRTRPQ